MLHEAPESDWPCQVVAFRAALVATTSVEDWLAGLGFASAAENFTAEGFSTLAEVSHGAYPPAPPPSSSSKLSPATR